MHNDGVIYIYIKFLVSFKSWLRVRLEELSEAQHLAWMLLRWPWAHLPSDALARGVKCTGGLLGTRLLFLEQMLRERSAVTGKSQTTPLPSVLEREVLPLNSAVAPSGALHSRPVSL